MSIGPSTRDSADLVRAAIERGERDPSAFRAALLAVPAAERDDWLDRVLHLGALPDDEDLPTGCVPYLPCAVDALLHVIERAEIGPDDVFVDVGAGVGRAALLVHLLTGATALGIEVQPRLVRTARAVTARLGGAGVAWLEGEATALIESLPAGSVFFLYCPFSGGRLRTFLGALASIARARPVRVACVDLPLPPCRWLVPRPSPAPGVTIFESATAAWRVS